MRGVVRKHPQYALAGGQGQAPLWLYEPGDAESVLRVELQVKMGKFAHVTLGDTERVRDGGEPVYALGGLREHRSAMRGARVVAKSARVREVDDLAALAVQARGLMSANDPDAIRRGLAEIAEALEAISRSVRAAA
jgi:hypothetical protein